MEHKKGVNFQREDVGGNTCSSMRHFCSSKRMYACFWVCELVKIRYFRCFIPTWCDALVSPTTKICFINYFLRSVYVFTPRTRTLYKNFQKNGKRKVSKVSKQVFLVSLVFGSCSRNRELTLLAP